MVSLTQECRAAVGSDVATGKNVPHSWALCSRKAQTFLTTIRHGQAQLLNSAATHLILLTRYRFAFLAHAIRRIEKTCSRQGSIGTINALF